MFGLRIKKIHKDEGRKRYRRHEQFANLSGTLLSIFDLLSNILDVLLLLGPFFVL